MSMNETISKIEQALELLAENPRGSWLELMKGWKTPYYNVITSYLRKRGITEPDGNSLRWVGDKPSRTLAALIYEEAREEARKQKAESQAKSDAKPKRTKPTKQEIAVDALGYDPTPDTLPPPPRKDDLTRGLAIMEHAIKAGVVDPVAFAKALLKDSRI